MSLDVLIVDDSKVMRSMVRRVLQMSGLSVSSVKEAADGHEALRLASDQVFNLFVVDVNMPGVNGVELVGELRRHDATKNTPVVIISAGMSGARMELMHSLSAHFVRKPFTAEGLVETIRHAVGATSADLNRVLAEATISSLEQLCFAVPEHLELDSDLLDVSRFPGAYVAFRGARPGGLALWVEPTALSSLAGNMLGSEEPPSPSEAVDALNEVARVLCVQVHTRLFGDDAVDDLEMPRPLGPSEPPLASSLRELTRVQLCVEGGPVVASLFVNRAT